MERKGSSLRNKYKTPLLCSLIYHVADSADIIKHKLELLENINGICYQTIHF